MVSVLVLGAVNVKEPVVVIFASKNAPPIARILKVLSPRDINPAPKDSE